MTIDTATEAFIDGALTEAHDGQTIETYEPGKGAVLADVADCGELDVERAVRSARKAFDEGPWARMSPQERKSILLTYAQLVADDLGNLARLDAINAGKPITDCEDGDVPDAINTLRWYAEAADKVYDRLSPTGLDTVAMIVREPIGVVGAVLPWNFPIATLAWKLGPALATGSSIVVKPPEQAPLSTIRMAELAVQAGIPAGVFNVVPGRGEGAGRAIGLSPGVNALTFTGSTAVGREFLRYSADSNLKEVVLECGGKSPQIVMANPSLDFEYVASQLAQAAFWNNGQNCTAGSRILVQSSIQSELVGALVAATSALKVGDPLDHATRLGPVIELSALERSLRYVRDARAAGASIAYGGERTLEETGGWYLTPAVLSDVTPDMAVAREEIFGPVTSVITFDTEEEAIAIANDSTYGLAASLFTHDLDQAHRMARAVRAGTVAVNCYSEGDIGTPFGGYNQSGFGGRDKGLEALDQYSEKKTIWISLKG
jgi:4-(gamma-glutamylamino)butanal dehydrogenase